MGIITIIMSIKNSIFAFLIFLSSFVCAENVLKINHINFQGLPSYLQEEMIKKIIFSTEKEFDKNNNHSIKFSNTKQLDNIQILNKKNTIPFTVNEYPIISHIFFIGNDLIDSNVLKNYLIQLGIKEGNAFKTDVTDIFIKSIEKIYHEFGKYGVQVKLLKKISSKNEVDLKIIIEEGQSSQISNITINGNRIFSNSQLLSLFQLNNHSQLWNGFNKNTYYPKKLQDDLDILANFYLNQGYFYFKIEGLKINFSADKKFVNIDINISEGDVYKISECFINGELLNFDTLIKNAVNIHQNDIYSKEKIDLMIYNIKKILSNNGYIDAGVILYPEINHVTKKIALNFNIDLKKRYVVNKILFSGNTVTKDIILRREMKQKENFWFNDELVQLGKQALEKTQFFKNIKILVQLVSPDSNKVNIVYVVEENKTGSINFGLGYGLDNGISANISFSQDNLFGSGNALKSTIMKNRNEKYADLSILIPHFFNDHFNLTNKIFLHHSKQHAAILFNTENHTIGFENNIGIFFNPGNMFNIGLGYTHNSVVNIAENKKKHNIKQSSDSAFLKNRLLNDFTLNYSWMYDHLKYLYFPISGNKINIIGKSTLPFSNNHFNKLIVESEQYIPLNKKSNFLFFLRIFMGKINNLHDHKIPVYERFYANSENTIRGFYFNAIGPKNISNISDEDTCLGYQKDGVCKSMNSVGGDSTMIANVEFIFPTPFLSEKYVNLFRSSLFFDVGSIWDTEWKNKRIAHVVKSINYGSLNRIYASAGFALRWSSPLGTLVLSYAYPFQKNQHYQIENLQFNIGKTW